MVGIVLVSHVFELAEGVAELARQMGGPGVAIETAGGLDGPDHAIGTDAVRVMDAVERAWSEDGVLVLMDLGSAVLSAEMALDLLPEDRRTKVLLCEAPFVEGAVAAAVTSKLGSSLEDVAAEARGALASKITHLGAEDAPPGIDERSEAPSAAGRRSIRVVVDNEHGLHARPAARLVQVGSAFDAQVQVRNLTTGRGPARVTSLNAVATLGVLRGPEIEISAEGPHATDALDALGALAARRFDEADGAEPKVIQTRTPEAGPPGAIVGRPASPGGAVGPARHLHPSPLVIPERQAGDPAAELDAIDRAIEAAREDIGARRASISRSAGEAEASIFDAHLLFLQDDDLLGVARRSIREGGPTAERAWSDAVDELAEQWASLDDPYLRARVADVKSVGEQVLGHLLGTPILTARMDLPGILIAADLTPADASALDPSICLAVITSTGGPTSHAAVLARSLGIPAVVGAGPAVLEIPEGTALAVDADTGAIVVGPDDDLVARIEAAETARRAGLDEARRAAKAPARTADGVLIEVSANIGSSAEIERAVAAGADGVGLFRTEFLFLGRASLPDEEEQVSVYREAAAALGGRPLLIRTLDVGADKPLPSLPQPAEDNPFLGVRGIRLGLAMPEVLSSQLRAILRVAAEHPLRVMFPMVSTVAELRDALELLDAARRDLSPAGAELEVGVMIEVPAAALAAASLAPHVDFFSIGTNDLTQYVMAADRGNARVAGLADPLHPALLKLIAATADAAAAAGIWVGVCGELAGDPGATGLLLGFGVRELSMSSPSIPLVKRAVGATDLARARALARAALASEDATAVRALLTNET